MLTEDSFVSHIKTHAGYCKRHTQKTIKVPLPIAISQPAVGCREKHQTKNVSP